MGRLHRQLDTELHENYDRANRVLSAIVGIAQAGEPIAYCSNLRRWQGDLTCSQPPDFLLAHAAAAGRSLSAGRVVHANGSRQSVDASPTAHVFGNEDIIRDGRQSRLEHSLTFGQRCSLSVIIAAGVIMVMALLRHWQGILPYKASEKAQLFKGLAGTSSW